jgi:NAD(P)-dependent dehydrogenase (short-subunit alcohol dehydrogenase family)
MPPVAIVTGAAHGIGRACVERLAADGFQVVASDIDGEALSTWVEQSGFSDSVRARTLDVTDVPAGQALVADTVATCGRVDALANVAGYTSRQSLEEIDTYIWNSMLDVMVRGPVFLTKAVAEDMIRRGEPGSIVNVSSIRSESAEPGQAHYCSAKGALRTVTRAIAQELAPYQVRVNCVGPGLTATRMTADIRLNSELYEQRKATVPVGRYATAAEVASCVAFLLSPRSSYVTGTTLYADGGYLAALGKTRKW